MASNGKQQHTKILQANHEVEILTASTDSIKCPIDIIPVPSGTANISTDSRCFRLDFAGHPVGEASRSVLVKSGLSDAKYQIRAQLYDGETTTTWTAPQTNLKISTFVDTEIKRNAWKILLVPDGAQPAAGNIVGTPSLLCNLIKIPNKSF